MKALRALLFHYPKRGSILVATEDDVYAIRCFRSGERKPTDKLTVDEAQHFCNAALHLANYLTKEYGLPGRAGGHTKEASKPLD